jgi:glycosyltransferase involved in cell wall biosynthesis
MGGKLLHSSVPERIFQFVRLLPQVWRLAKLIRSRKVQLMHCDLTRSVLSSGWAAKLTGIPLIWHVKGDKVGYLDDIAFVLSDRVVSVSENIENMLCRRWKSTCKVVTVRDGIPLKRFVPHISGQAVRQEFGFADDDIVVGTVGALGTRKGHHIFISMAKTLASQCPTARFVIVGDITHEDEMAYKKHLLSLGQELIADGRLVLAGWRDDMPAVYAAMDVFTLASSAEGLPLAMIEAMAMAKPTVSSMTVSANELVADGKTGYVVPINDVPAMAAAMKKLVADRDLRTRMGAAARDRAVSMFSVEQMVQGMERVFLESLRKPTQ